MNPDELQVATDRLAAKYTSVERREITTLLRQAGATVSRVVGIDDPATAEDLVQLRLDVRSGRRPGSTPVQ